MQTTNASSTDLKFTYAVCPQCLQLNKISVSKAKTAKPICGSCKTEIDLKNGILTTDARQLQRLIEKSPIAVVVDFWAPWCGPCRSFAPTFERAAQEKAGGAVFAKLNTEDNPSASQTYGIRGIPTIATFRSGRELDRLGGALPYDHFRQWVEETALLPGR